MYGRGPNVFLECLDSTELKNKQLIFPHKGKMMGSSRPWKMCLL